LVELHHGTISAQSEIGKGSAFTVLMPLGKQHFTKKELSSNSQTPSHKAKDTSVFALSPNYSQLTAPQNAATILLVEDNYELRKYIQYAFSAQYKIIEAADGAIGYEMAKDLIPDLIISDVIMPNLSGIEFCKRIKQNLVTSHIPIILLTAKVTLEDQLMGLEIGADAYITKPFNVKQLELTTRNLIETRQKLYKRFSQDVYISPQEITENHLDQDFLEKAINYIETNISSVELSVENLAAHLNMSSTHVWRKIKSLSGQSTTQFIRTIRLKNAIKLMESNKFQLSEIGYMVGFSSPSYFTKCFREQYGKSPSSYLAKEGKE
ncbi:MAG: hypothetical protein RIS47_1955, partial [Bacteroidota bacterium]